MQLNDIIIVSVMVSDAYTVTDTDLIPPKMANNDISIWYWCIPNYPIQYDHFPTDSILLSVKLLRFIIQNNNDVGGQVFIYC